MVHAERSMTKREFAEIARATLNQMGKSDYKVVIIDSPLEAALETPEVFMQIDPVAYTTTDTIYFYWYYLKHFTYTYQLTTIRHETVHALAPNTHIDESTGLGEISLKDWDEYFESFSFPREEYFTHKVQSDKEDQDIIDYTDENLKSPVKDEEITANVQDLKMKIIKTFYNFNHFFSELIPEINNKMSEKESFLKDLEEFFP